MLDINKIKKDFPLFSYHPELIYLDSAATSLKPQSVIDKTTQYYREYSANIHRGVYAIAERASAEYEETRELVAEFIHATSSQEIVFTRNATESLNLVMYSWGKENIREGDEIVITILEHHANFVIWQELAHEKKAVLKVIPLTKDQELDEGIEKYISKKTKVFAFTHLSNVTGEIIPARELIQKARSINPNIIIVLDGAQSVPHIPIDVVNLDCDFFVFSSHKMLGPTGVGVLWGKMTILNGMKPYNYGGDMIRAVHMDTSTYQDPPYRFEAGTPDIAGVIALGEAIRYLRAIGLEEIRKHEGKLAAYAFKSINREFGNELKIIGPKTSKNKSAIFAFTFATIHPHDIAQMLDEYHIAVRAGHHCAMPLHESLSITATCRASFYLYNNESDVDKLIEGLKQVRKILT